jgi:penicillin amidase
MADIAGPRGPIAYTRDAWGYPSIRARDRADGAFAHGWLIAADRMAQVYLTLTFGRGRLMELVGDAPLHRLVDRSARLFDLTRDLRDACGALEPESRRVLQAYCDGFNAGAKAHGRPLVMRLLGLRADPFTVEDILLVYRAIAYFGLVSQQHAAEGAVTELVAARAPRRAFDLLLGELAAGLDAEALAGVKLPAGGLAGVTTGGGSNAVAVSKRRSRTGGALLLSEFHLEIGKIPPPLYILHFDFEDGSSMQGVNFPGLAWISAGRTDRVAWTMTFGHADNMDILVERCDGGRYLASGTWRPLRRREETVRVRGKRKPERWVFHETDYGTIEGEAAAGDHPSIRWSGQRIGAAGLEAALATERCEGVDDLARTQNGYRDIPLHVLMADSSGRIARILTGQVDERPPGWTGAYPRKGWDLEGRSPAPLPESTRPFEVDPPSGLFVSANERIDGPQSERWISFPEPRWRYDRLLARLSAADAIGLDDILSASYDEHDLGAAALLKTWAPLLPDDPDARALVAWGRSPSPSGEEGARRHGLYLALRSACIRALLESSLGADAARGLLDENSMLLVNFEHALDRALALERPEVLNERDLTALLGRAWPEAKARARKNRATAGRTRFVNAYFEGKLPGFLGLDSAPLEVPGGPVSPFQRRTATIAGKPFLGGPSFHVLFDMSQRGGWYNIAGGASERRFGPGYGAGLDAWHKGDLAPLGNPTGPKPELPS